jgi:two-component system, NtrC family, sensor histidine kinase KinB
MLKSFLTKLEKRPPIQILLSTFRNLFQKDSANQLKFSEEAFAALLIFLEKGEASFQHVAVQAGARWSASTQRVMLRNAILRRGFLTPSCLWAFRQMRGNPEELFKDYPSPEMCLMQIILLKEADPARSVPFLIQRFLNRREALEELRAASRLCILSIFDSGVSPEQIRYLQSRYPGVEDLYQRSPGILGGELDLKTQISPGSVDFHQLVRSVRDMKEFSSLTRTVYLASLFYVPLSTKEWRSILLSRTDQLFFQKLRPAGLLETSDGGFILSSDPAKQTMVKKLLYDSYAMAKESVHRNRVERQKEDRQRRVRSKELDRQALEILPDGIICVDRSGLLYYINPAAEFILNENRRLRESLFGNGSLEQALRCYSRDRVLSRISTNIAENGYETQVFGDRIIITSGGKRFEVKLGAQVILLRDTTDQFLINREIGRLYRHELKAALDVMCVGIETAKQLFKEDRVDDGLDFLDQVEQKRSDLCSMLEERIDFIRLHSDAFRVRPSEVNLNLVVDKCVGNYRESAAAKSVAIVSDHLDTQIYKVRGEERFLIRALDNIIRNAVKFCYTGSEIKVSIGSKKFGLFVCVEDSGPGIPHEDIEKIFQLGFTTGGTGRGLYLARRIAAAHGGRIEVRSEPGKGASFSLRLPLLTE